MHKKERFFCKIKQIKDLRMLIKASQEDNGRREVILLCEHQEQHFEEDKTKIQHKSI